jgi:hypothetical protein
VGTVQASREHRSAADPLIAQHGGRTVKTSGDGVLIEFGSVVGAVECALALQRLAAERNAGTRFERHMEWRIGVHIGNVLIEGAPVGPMLCGPKFIDTGAMAVPIAGVRFGHSTTRRRGGRRPPPREDPA